MLHFSKSWCEEKDCIWLSSGAMLFLETHTRVMESLPVTLLFFTRTSSPIKDSTASILLPNSRTISLSSSSHSSCHFTPLVITFITVFDVLQCMTDCVPSSVYHSFSLLLYIPSTFPANTLSLSINFFSCSALLFGPFLFHRFRSEITNLLPS